MAGNVDLEAGTFYEICETGGAETLRVSSKARVPTPTDGECLIKVERASVCGSDIRHGYSDIAEENYPMPPGRPCHEVAGVVVESRTDDFREGQRVIVLPGKGHGGLTEYLVSNPGMMVLLPDEGPLEEWVMCQPSGTVLYSCQQMPNILGQERGGGGAGKHRAQLHHDYVWLRGPTKSSGSTPWNLGYPSPGSSGRRT